MTDDGQSKLPLRRLSPGELFAGRYRVQARIGAGGMGDVYRVHDTVAGEPVALKLLGAPGSGAVRRFRRELRLARKVTHKNVARTFDLGEAEGSLFLTLELIEGRNLAAMLREERQLEPLAAVRVVRDVANGLIAAHEVGVVHRDLKPGNVLVARDGRVIVIDFGVARSMAADANTGGTEGFVGTPDYMAPEQIAGQPTGPFTDVYAVGLLLFEALTGARPFTGETAIARGFARLLRPPPDLRGLVQVPEPLAALVDACLRQQVAERPGLSDVVATLSAVGDELEQVSQAERDPITQLMPAAAPATTVVDDLFGLEALEEPSSSKVSPPLAPQDRVLAVLPFTFRGDEQLRHLGVGISEELIDVLSMTKGLRVLAAGAAGVPEAAAMASSERDPRDVGERLGADSVVDGTVTWSSKTVRIAARLVEVSTGVQLWAGHFDGKCGEVLQLQERMAIRIAEALRLELEVQAYRTSISADAADLFVQARRMMRANATMRPRRAVEVFDRCLALAPGFALAEAARALACARAWYFPDPEGGVDWAAVAQAAARRALEVAGGTTEAHLAAGIVAAQAGRYPDAAAQLSNALAVAPTHACAHEYLGRLECEAGRPEQGMKRLKLAVELDATLAPALTLVARAWAMRGRRAPCGKALERARRLLGFAAPEVLLMELRIAHWHGDRAAAAAVLTRLPRGADPTIAFIEAFARFVLGDAKRERVTAFHDVFLGLSTCPRFLALTHQIAAEVAAHEDPERALEHLAKAADGALIDVDWVLRCPALAGLRPDPRFTQVVRRVQARADRMWE